MLNIPSEGSISEGVSRKPPQDEMPWTTGDMVMTSFEKDAFQPRMCSSSTDERSGGGWSAVGALGRVEVEKMFQDWRKHRCRQVETMR